ncbi:MAG TPA: hypothetical protein VNX02_18240 [Steroidobacteraceae bacterium]|nr:hypothetical protein [Steroidobacteraceae bacterium]
MAKLLIYESRRLVLPLETALDAVLELDRERGGRLSMASISDARIETGEQPCLVFEAAHSEAVTPEQRSYPLAAVAAAVIHYCWKNKIPLPRNWAKSIDIVPEGFALSLQGTVEIPRRHDGVSVSARAAAPATAAEAESAEPASGAQLPAQ